MNNKDEWETPQWLFDKLNEEFDFCSDVAATEENSKVEEHFYDKEDNGLTISWSWMGNENYSAFCNPPFSKNQVYAWIEKAQYEALKNNLTVVCLIPAATGTKYFQDIIFPAERRYQCEIRFLKGRIKFEIDGKPSKNSPYFDNAIVIFGKNRHGIMAVDYRANQ